MQRRTEADGADGDTGIDARLKGHAGTAGIHR